MDIIRESQFLERMFELIKSQNILTPGFENKVVNFLHPKELQREINFKLEEKCDNLEDLENLCKDVIKYSVKTNNPNFYNQLYGGSDLYGLAGSFVSDSLNTNQYTFEVAPVFSIIEQHVIKHVKQLAGYDAGDGIFSPGGSVSNMYGMVLARFKMFPDIKFKGLQAFPPLIAFTSEDAHYSIEKGIHWLGIGTDNLIKIPTDQFGRMIPEILEQEIEKYKLKGSVPFFVNATIGTTVLGSVDPIEQIADICERHGVWLHIDACYGGTLLLSRTYRQRLKGINRSDSFSWNPHKMLGAPLQCAMFITRSESMLHHCNSASATYLYQKDKFYDISYDTGDKSIQCGRKVDAFKLWIMWKARGDSGFEKLVDNAMDCARYFKQQIESRIGFRLLQDTFEVSIICFWYIPETLRGKEETKEWWQKMNEVAPLLKEKMLISGTLMIGYSPLPRRGICNFFRMLTTCQPPPSYEHMDYVISQIEHFGNQL